METIEMLLHEIPLFAGLEPAQLELIAGCGSNVHFDDDQVLFREGDPADTFYVVRPYRWHFDARALSPVRATAFDAACLRGKCDDDPKLGYALMSRFAGVLIERLQWTRLRLLDIYGSGRS
jgi:CRP/FNR family cyclic AMP-dependent transcriptional regulator